MNVNSCRFILYITLQEFIGKPGCWGYESLCPHNDSYSRPHCPGDHRGWVPNKEAQEQTFYTQGDFGYIAEQQRELAVICEPNFAVSAPRHINVGWICQVIQLKEWFFETRIFYKYSDKY